MRPYSVVAEEIPVSPIRTMMVRAAAMSDCISFAVGDPDFPAPQSVIDGMEKALQAKMTHYAPGAGITELREVYAEYLSEMTGNTYGVENVAVTVGGMSALFIGLLSLVSDGDEVLIAAPYFSNYCQMVKMCHATPISVDVYEKDDFQLTAESVLKAITPKTKVLMINSPCNPTGGILTYDCLRKLADIAIEHDLFVLSDEVYRHIIFDGETNYSISSFPGMQERTFIVDSCSKTFAMTGLRVGFAAGPKELIDLIIKLTEGVYSAAGTPNQYAAIEAFRTGLDYTKEMLGEYERRRNYLYEHLNEMKGISCIKPKGAFYIFTNISGTGLNATDFANRLLDEAHVAVVPGENFGSVDGSGYVRISYATSMENIIEGCRRMKAFCDTL